MRWPRWRGADQAWKMNHVVGVCVYRPRAVMVCMCPSTVANLINVGWHRMVYFHVNERVQHDDLPERACFIYRTTRNLHI